MTCRDRTTLVPMNATRAVTPSVTESCVARRRATSDPRHGLLFDKRRQVILEHDLDLARVLEPSLDQFFRERIANALLYGATHRSRAIERLVAFFDQPSLDILADLKLHPTLHQPDVELSDQDIQDAHEMLFDKLMEDHHFVDSVEELRAERPTQFSQHLLLHALIVVTLLRPVESERHAFLDKLGPQVGGHDDQHCHSPCQLRLSHTRGSVDDERSDWLLGFLPTGA